MNGRSGLSLKDDITIESIENTKKKVLSKANINGSIKKISLDFFRMKEYWVVYTR
jgi:hypothetical protein